MVSKLVRDVPYSGIRRFFEIVAKSKDVVSLGVGEPDFPTPEPMKQAGERAILGDESGYTSNWGLLELREKIAGKLRRENGLSMEPGNQILVTTGTSEALDLACRAILDPGDEVIVPEPSYVAYKPCVWFAHGRPVPVASSEDDGFRVRARDVEAALTKRTKAIIVASPNNPTGGVLRKSDLEEIAALAEEHDLTVISDELYEYLVYDDARHHSIASLPGMADRTVTINGWSKGYAFTGWRLGYAAGPAETVEAMMKIHQYTMLSAPTVAQHAALEFDRCGKHVKEMVREYDSRRRLLVSGLNELPGVSCITPKGAFYAFPNVKGTGLTSEAYAARLLAEANVAVVPGSTFGDSGEGYVRCSYSVSEETIREALERMRKLNA